MKWSKEETLKQLSRDITRYKRGLSKVKRKNKVIEHKQGIVGLQESYKIIEGNDVIWAAWIDKSAMESHSAYTKRISSMTYSRRYSRYSRRKYKTMVKIAREEARNIRKKINDMVGKSVAEVYQDIDVCGKELVFVSIDCKKHPDEDPSEIHMRCKMSGLFD